MTTPTDDLPNVHTPDPAPPSKVDPLDMSRLNEIHLKIQNLELQERLLKSDLEKAALMKRNTAFEAQMFFQAWKTRYGFDPTQERDRLQPDGTILPK